MAGEITEINMYSNNTVTNPIVTGITPLQKDVVNIFSPKEMINEDFFVKETNGPKVKYYESTFSKVHKNTKMGVCVALEACEKNVDAAFFKDMYFHVTRNFSNLDSSTPQNRRLRNTSFMHKLDEGIIVTGNNRDIYIQEIHNYTLEKAKILALHEMGHSFDEYYGCIDKSMQPEFTRILRKSYTESLTKEEIEFKERYKSQNGYSDRQEFKDAIVKDFESINIAEAKKEFPYFFERVLDSKGAVPTKENIDTFDYLRAEIFAELFARNIAKNEEKEGFVKLFSNANIVVKKRINEHKANK